MYITIRFLITAQYKVRDKHYQQVITDVATVCLDLIVDVAYCA